MGRQAKRKKQRQQPSNTTSSGPDRNLHFMQQLQQQGYSPEAPGRAPEIPETRSEPQI